MGILIAFFIGVISGAFTVAFISGASTVKREQKAYMEGFLAGQNDKGVTK